MRSTKLTRRTVLATAAFGAAAAVAAVCAMPQPPPGPCSRKARWCWRGTPTSPRAGSTRSSMTAPPAPTISCLRCTTG